MSAFVRKKIVLCLEQGLVELIRFVPSLSKYRNATIPIFGMVALPTMKITFYTGSAWAER